MITRDFIERLVENSAPVQPLAPPEVRTIFWTALALPYVALVTCVVGPRTDLTMRLQDAQFAAEISAAFATGIAAALAAFATAIPGHNRRIVILPLVPLTFWLGSMGRGCIDSFIGPEGLSLRPDWFCIPAIVLIGAIPAIAMALMLRRGAPLTPYLTSALGGLAAAGLGNFGLRLIHEQDASLMVLVWQFGTVFVLTTLAAVAGRWLLDWSSMIESSRARTPLFRHDTTNRSRS